MKNWIDNFHKDGFLVVPSVLNKDQCLQLKKDLDSGYNTKNNKKNKKKGIFKRMFEHSPANLELFWQEPIVTFAEKLIADNGSDEVLLGENLQAYTKGIPSANEVHVIHNNSFIIGGGKNGLGGSTWHQDDTPHITSLDGNPITNVRLNVLAITCLYYLTDVPSEEYGPTQFIRGSHLFGLHCTNERAEQHQDKIVSALGPAGTCVIINNQTWHRGGPNPSNTDRYVTQITYAKRLIGHKYGKFMNYQMPEHVINAATDDRKRRLIGFFGHGAYG
jgi:ectoine hydroxylase-related dioxygenase (phytanoyl-CoA dioxygenase family)